MRNETHHETDGLQNTSGLARNLAAPSSCETPVARGWEDLRAAFVRASAATTWPCAFVADRAGTVARAECELMRVHCAEIACVLARAVTLLERNARHARVQAFQRRARAALAAARAAGACVPAAAECVVTAPAHAWPSKLRLARCAWDLAPSLEYESLCARLQADGTEA